VDEYRPQINFGKILLGSTQRLRILLDFVRHDGVFKTWSGGSEDFVPNLIGLADLSVLPSLLAIDTGKDQRRAVHSIATIQEMERNVADPFHSV